MAKERATIALEWRTISTGGNVLTLWAERGSDRAMIDGWIRSDDGPSARTRGQQIAKVLGIRFVDRRDEAAGA
jgi:hypothetical protein